MTEYEIIEFQQGFELDDNADVVTAQITQGGSNPSSNASNRALVRRPADGGTATPSEGVDEFLCGAQTAGGQCERAVSEPDENCWQHQDND